MAESAVTMPVRPWYRDPLLLLGLGYFLYCFAEFVMEKGVSWANVITGVFAGIVAVGRAAAPYIRTWVELFDKDTPPQIGLGGGPREP